MNQVLRMRPRDNARNCAVLEILRFGGRLPYCALPMPTLQEKIEANAASRLTLPPNRNPVQELARYKNFLKVESHRLKILHRAGGGGREICLGRAALLDVLLRYLLEAALRDVPRLTSAGPPPI